MRPIDDPLPSPRAHRMIRNHHARMTHDDAAHLYHHLGTHINVSLDGDCGVTRASGAALAA
jgi:hypothetical protein